MGAQNSQLFPASILHFLQNLQLLEAVQLRQAFSSEYAVCKLRLMFLLPRSSAARRRPAKRLLGKVLEQWPFCGGYAALPCKSVVNRLVVSSASSSEEHQQLLQWHTWLALQKLASCKFSWGAAMLRLSAPLRFGRARHTAGLRQT